MSTAARLARALAIHAAAQPANDARIAARIAAVRAARQRREQHTTGQQSLI